MQNNIPGNNEVSDAITPQFASCHTHNCIYNFERNTVLIDLRRGVQAYQFEKHNFELEVEGEG